VLRRVSLWLLVLALSFSIGLPWAFLQGAAWLGMLVSYSRESTLTQSIAKTFDGDHPCKLCEAVQRGESSQKRLPHALPALAKLDLVEPECETFIFPKPSYVQPALAPPMMGGMAARPQTPPPERA